jgi:hypothetical protein
MGLFSRLLVAVFASVVVCAESYAQATSAEPAECSIDGLLRKNGEGREEPQIEGHTGWIVAIPQSDDERASWKRKPWKVRTLVQAGPTIYRPIGPPLAHKTPVRVMKQRLRHRSHGRYEGLLDVETSNGKRFTIELDSYTFRPFWACQIRALKYHFSTWAPSRGVMVVRIAKAARPVDYKGDWTILKKQEQLLCEAQVQTGRYLKEPVLSCRVLDARGHELPSVEVKMSDATILY